jgi:RimJ/RimL family protein N-acetyltransferase
MARQPPPYRPRRLVLRDGREVTLRAITEADAPAIQRAFDLLSVESRYSRFLHHKKHLSPEALARGVHPLPGRDFVFVATAPHPGGIDVVGAAQYVRATPGDDTTCEFAITLAEDWRGSGLARHLLASLLRRARRDQYAVMMGLVLADNEPMIALVRKLRFSVAPSSEGSTVVQVLRRLDRQRSAQSLAPAAARRP